MSKPSRRPTRQARKEHTQKRREAQRQVREERAAAGLKRPALSGVSNRLSPYETEAEEQAAREEAAAGQLGVLRQLLPKLLKDLAKIPDPRQPKKLKHKLTTVLLYGLFSFVFQMASRREANRELSRPAFMGMLQELFPELESLPHADTLHRVLCQLAVEQLEQAHVELLRRLIRGKKFRRYLIDKHYPIAIDGTQKLVRNGPWWNEQWLERRRQGSEGESLQQYVDVLEANLVLPGMSLPLLSEFLSYGEGDPDDHKQDCELKAFSRLAERLKAYFPHLPILLLLDGLYPNGPLIQRCQRYQWHFMIVLPEKCLPSVWEEVNALKPRLLHQRHTQSCNGRRQEFWWVNNLLYSFDRNRHQVPLHGVGCEETWPEIDPDTGQRITRHARHVWISSHPLHSDTVHARCNLGARRRWGIETSFQVEKHQGYHYEHLFAQDWNALKGYHYLMRLAHLLNALALATKRLVGQVQRLGVQAFLRFVRESCANRWLRPEWLRQLRAHPGQLRLE